MLVEMSLTAEDRLLLPKRTSRPVARGRIDVDVVICERNGQFGAVLGAIFSLGNRLVPRHRREATIWTWNVTAYLHSRPQARKSELVGNVFWRGKHRTQQRQSVRFFFLRQVKFSGKFQPERKHSSFRQKARSDVVS